MPAAANPNADADLTPAELARGRALKLINDFAIWLRHDRQLDPAAIGAAMALVDVANLQIDPNSAASSFAARVLDSHLVCSTTLRC